ncbi:MAG: ribonucleoside-diphosphate reductase subunit alpha [Roseibacillus sp.]|jgi:ribonucleoside-diphosphate reductase alpha chain|nr:ribonucleoside-diphosphate reductase subunit alpha [Roseibacillus sp.]MCP4729911.1 ribonucleoside-diphosphate reductase subunit alpha [Roseibacillus sp.]MDP7308241.1 ribonucleoside-diphosphate reductase subunit alpha [Roseibacillus sp.]HJM62211.1 ribonucleoside-diphosphate reductase subunit alpha [Roseibacillus sp.]|tara:strand:- start:17501 stop:20773 length:3273 start_codon:yes stop_codon:yes gene_type:complete
MYRSITLEEDIALKQVIASRHGDEASCQRFNWRDSLETEHRAPIPEIIVTRAAGEVEFSLADVADTIGEALTDLLLSREEQEDRIYNDENRNFVTGVAFSVAKSLMQQVQRGGAIKLSQNDLYLLIEKALIENDAHDVAKSLVFTRSYEKNGEIVVSEDLHLMPVRLIRRNGNVVPWSETKIETAVRKAFLDLRKDPEPATRIAHGVTQRVRAGDSAFVHIEDVQDLVEEELGRQGQFDVMRAYMSYRIQRAEVRKLHQAESAEDPNQDSMVVVTRENGQSDFWDGTELKKRIQFSMIGLDLCVSEEEIELDLRRSIGAEISEAELQRTIILNAKTLIERDADFAKFAARILLSYIYEEVLDWSIQQDGIAALKAAHQKQFKRYLKYGVAIKRISPELLERFDLDRLADAFDPSADLDFDYLGIQTLYDRYLIVDKTSVKPRRIETPQFFWMRVAMGLFKAEEHNREEWVVRLYQLYKGRRFCSSTPTLFNSGTLHSQLSSCYLYKVDDSIESIMLRGISENAFLSKWAGGLGGSWTSVRGTGAYIQGTNGESQGVIPFLKLHNDQLVAVNQGGKRRGSGCAYLESWHNDIEDFLELRVNTGDERRRTHDMNTANWIPDLFMKRMESRQDWTLLRANECSDLHDLYGKAFEQRYLEYEAMAAEGKIWSRSLPAIELWKKMLKMLFETGHPWITFKDPCNLRSPQDHVGVIHSSNLCTEITLNTSEDETAVCNLGSVVLDTHVTKDGMLDHEMLRETITVAIRALDNVIDINFYPTDAARTANSRHRPIGLGVMGLQNALFKKELSFASEEAVAFNDEFMEAIAYYAYGSSSDLAAERGTYSTYRGSKWDRGILPQDSLDLLEDERGEEIIVPRGGKMDWRPVRDKILKHGMRNSNVLAIAPTATISNIMGTTPCIEPNYKNLFVKSNLSGDFTVLNRQLVQDLKKEDLWTSDMLDQLKYFDGELDDIDEISDEIKQKHLTVFGVGFQFIVDAASRRQKWIDQSQSVNLFLAEPDMKALSHMYRHAWRVGLKTTYYLRTLQASNIEKATVQVKKDDVPQESASEGETYTPEEQHACSIEAMMNGGECEACQ